MIFILIYEFILDLIDIKNILMGFFRKKYFLKGYFGNYPKYFFSLLKMIRDGFERKIFVR